ncbi:TOBE domain-containing protein [bacterium]|nr:TOBE domain-containing protein [bacterium]MBU1434163.1 TOBE domain-containing protein [bacterium]MBU1504258.1 TOBE domain-containing protein [bacterium]
MKIDGRFWLTKDDKSFLGAGRVELLHKIEKTGSINAAAKEMKMSYKAAWERINSMNELADEPLIERKIGGSGGGGTTLTPYAYELIKTYERLNELHRQFIDRFAEAGDDPERLARILSRTFLTTSARNQIPTTISRIEQIGLHARIEMPLSEESSLVSYITTKSAQNMGLNLGSEVYAIIKSSDISIVNAAPESWEDTNVIKGHIKDIELSDEFIELTFAIKNGKKFIAFLDKTEANSFKVGDEAYAVIRTNNIIIGS